MSDQHLGWFLTGYFDEALRDSELTAVGLDPGVRAQARVDCRRFVDRCATDLGRMYAGDVLNGDGAQESYERAGASFYLARNGHTPRRWHGAVGKRLRAAAWTFGTWQLTRTGEHAHA